MNIYSTCVIGFRYFFLVYNLILLICNGIEAKIYVQSLKTNETVRIIYDRNTRAVSDAIQGYLVVANPLSACTEVEPPPNSTSFIDAQDSFPDHLMKQWTLLATIHDCDIATKAKNAYRAGYSAIIIQNLGSNNSDSLHWHMLKFPLAKMNIINKVIVGEYDGDLLKRNYSFPNNRFYIRFEEDHFYQYVCYAVIGAIFVLLITLFIIFWVQVCCALLQIAPRVIRYRMNGSQQSGKKKLSKSMVEMIPIKNWNINYPFQICAICQEDFSEEDKIRLLPCLHGFHVQCIDPWLLHRSRRCPNCMQRIRFHRPSKSNEVGTQCNSSSHEPDRDPLLEVAYDDPDTELMISPENSVDDDDDVENTLGICFSPGDNSRLTISEAGSTEPKSAPKEDEDEDNNLDWQLKHFLAGFSFVPSSQESMEMTSDIEQNNAMHTKPNKNVKVSSKNEFSAEMKELPLLDTCLDSYSSLENLSISKGTGSRLLTPGTTTLDLQLHRCRTSKNSDATTISESLPRDDSFFDETSLKGAQRDNFNETDDDTSTIVQDLDEYDYDDVFDESSSML